MPEGSGATGPREPDGARLEARRHALAARVAAGAGHHLNNLLGRIIGLAEMTMDEVADRPTARAELETLIVTAEEAARLVRRLDSCAGPETSEPRRFDLGATVDAACRAAAGARPDLILPAPPPGDPCTVFADPDLVRLALDALLEDADRRTASRVEIRWRALPPDGEAEVVLRDDGGGPASDGLAGVAASEAGGRLETVSDGDATTVRLVLPTADDPPIGARD